MIRIAIVEDEPIYANTINEYICRYCDEKQLKYEVSIFQDGDEITKNYKAIYNIIFLDVEMKFMDGMETAEYIRNVDKEVILIFITNMHQYAIRGYAVDALSYLLKPVPYFAFSQEMNKSIERIKNRNNKNLLISTKKGIVKVNIRTIVYIESYKHNIIFHTEQDSYSIVGTLKEVEKKLQESSFYRCNNGYLVNLEHVTGIVDNNVLLSDFTLPISRAKKKGFLNSLTDYMGGVIK